MIPDTQLTESQAWCLAECSERAVCDVSVDINMIHCMQQIHLVSYGV